MIPAFPGLPTFAAANVPILPDLAQSLDRGMPVPQEVQVTDARAVEAAKLANDMRAAFAYSKAANKRSKAVAKAKGRQAQRIAERR